MADEKPVSPPEMCDCIALINEALVEHNTRLDVPFQINMNTGRGIEPIAMIATYKLDPKNRKQQMVTVLAKYCPFCGIEYPGVEERERVHAERAAAERS